MAFFGISQEKLHSEYRSTFKWHALTTRVQQQQQQQQQQPHQQPQQQQQQQPQQQPHQNHHQDVIIRKPPLPSAADDFPFMRKKKHPEIAYKSHEFFDTSLAPPAFGARDVVDAALQQGQVIHGHYNPAFSAHAPASSERNRQPTSQQSSGRPAQMKESISMGHILDSGLEQSQQALDSAVKAVSHMGVNDSSEEPMSKESRQYRTEYRKNFRPFSQYEYVDGRFVANAPIETSIKSASLHGEPWYQEVVELRRRAQDYKCRGWGVEMVPAHVSDMYHKQVDALDQATRRESLSALSLAISSPRCTASTTTTTTTSDKAKSSSEKISPTKYAPYRPSRPRTAPPARGPGSSAKSSRSESAHHPVSDTAAVFRASRDQPDAAKRAAGPVGHRAKSPVKAKVSRPASACTAPSSVVPSPALWTDGAGGKGGANNKIRRQRPTSLKAAAAAAGDPSTLVAVTFPARQETATAETCSQPAKVSSRSNLTSEKEGAWQRRPFSRSSSKTGGILASRDTSRPQSAFENNADYYFREPVVKSPLEPTRVKSPESMIRSPDPINWTVPLDTAKTFSVTQSIRDGDSNRNSPMSDHSSLFDSVLGTAINLGGRGPIQHPHYHHLHHHPTRISSLAKEAREFQPGLTKDSTMTRPECNKSVESEAADEAETSTKDERESLSNGQSGHVNGDKVQMKCVAEPSFEFDESAKTIDKTEARKEEEEEEEEEKIPLKKPSYRVLEDPCETEKNTTTPSTTTSTATAKRSTPYRVLEDPMMMSFYDASTSGSAGATAMTTTAATAGASVVGGGRPMASEVLEGARERFDKFWGKAKEAQES